MSDAETTGGPAPAHAGLHQPRPLPFDPGRLAGLSETLIRSHWENDCREALKAWATFAGSDDRAVVDGDFAMLETELQVLKALRSAGIDIAAIHQHMTGEQPRVLFLHDWGVGRTQDLARGPCSALEKTGARLASR